MSYDSNEVLITGDVFICAHLVLCFKYLPFAETLTSDHIQYKIIKQMLLSLEHAKTHLVQVTRAKFHPWKVMCCWVPSISGFIKANYSSQFHILPNGEF